ncbi:riboflavin synthase [Brevibacillus ginsengisoli]|uniref:riboflavin synthase n=1 Tax=Brevibacillus ginsengisoli TaxID=363854 RepID=UPI003CF3C9F9
MFTGIVEECGTLENIKTKATHGTLVFRADRVLQGVQLGDSIAVDGVCLTVTTFTSYQFTADIMPETMKHTSLGRLKQGDQVNLERAMLVGSRFGGHIVSGHVDGTGTILSRQSFANAVLFRIKPNDPSLLRYMILRGSITVSGISLTLVDVTDQEFSVSIIPHTLAHTSLGAKQAGDIVNLECDVIGKYVERLLQQSNENPARNAQSKISTDFLRENGFL